MLDGVKESRRLKGDLDDTLQTMEKHLDVIEACATIVGDANLETIHGFDKTVARQLISLAPPRDITLPDFKQV